MENLISLKMITENEKQLIKNIFTKLQLNIVKKKLQKKKLNSNERTYYYKYIKPKLRAMLAFTGADEMNIIGRENMIAERVPKAVRIIKQFQKKHKNRKIMLSGSFLFSANYDDIDLFIFTRYRKQDYQEENIHVTFLPENILGSLFFKSISLISVANFRHTADKEIEIRLAHILQSYEILVQLILQNNEHEKELRDFLLNVEYAARKVILNPKQLSYLTRKITKKNCIGLISKALVGALLFCFSKKELRNELNGQIRDYTGLLAQYPNAPNIEEYIKTYKEAVEIAA